MLILRNLLFLYLTGLLFSCASLHPDPQNIRESRPPDQKMVRSADEGISAIAAREVIRRQESLRRADAAALRANKYSSQGDQEAAIRSYRQALDHLPSEE